MHKLETIWEAAERRIWLKVGDRTFHHVPVGRLLVQVGILLFGLAEHELLLI